MSVFSEVLFYICMGGVAGGTWAQMALNRHRHEMFMLLNRHRAELVLLVSDTLQAVTDPALREERNGACTALATRHMAEMGALMRKHHASVLGRLMGRTRRLRDAQEAAQ